MGQDVSGHVVKLTASPLPVLIMKSSSTDMTNLAEMRGCDEMVFRILMEKNR